MEVGRALLLHYSFFAVFLLLSASLLYLNRASDASYHRLLLASASASLALVSVLLARARLLRVRSAGTGLPVRWFIGSLEEDPERGPNTRGKVAREGVLLFGNGDVYEGELSGGRCHGGGVYCFYEKGRYEGCWIDGKYEGHGIESWARGSRYRGQYRQGMRHGFGVYRFYDSDSYAGEWIGGKSQGCGVQTCSDGSCYAGEFKCGVKHGLGLYRFRNGDKYAGEYFGDKIHGFGVYNFANGHCYEGSWHEGRRQGFGTYTFRNGETRPGEWDYGVLKNSLCASDPAVRRAVEAARMAAEKSTKVPQVEEQVRQAVSAAKPLPPPELPRCELPRTRRKTNSVASMYKFKPCNRKFCREQQTRRRVISSSSQQGNTDTYLIPMENEPHTLQKLRANFRIHHLTWQKRPWTMY